MEPGVANDWSVRQGEVVTVCGPSRTSMYVSVSTIHIITDCVLVPAPGLGRALRVGSCLDRHVRLSPGGEVHRTAGHHLRQWFTLAGPAACSNACCGFGSTCVV